MQDLTNCATCGRLIDDAEGSLCDTCLDRAMEQHERNIAEREIAALALPGGIDHSDYLARMGLDEDPTEDKLAEEAYETALLNAANDEDLPFDGPVEDEDYPATSEYNVGDECLIGPKRSSDKGWFTRAIVTDVLPTGERMLSGVDGNTILYKLTVDYLYPRVDPRDARIAELEAQVKALEGQIGLFPVSVYNAYLETQDSRLSQVPYAMACMGLKDAMSRAILNRPTGYPIVPTGEA